jgi:peptidoglycan/LPS O-acetylase OafA/YrhL
MTDITGDRETEPKRTPELDGIRGIAILQVLVWHFQSEVASEPGTPLAYAIPFLSMTWTGVDLFFVLSGFLIGGLLIDAKGSRNYLRVFYVRRAFRILPLYLLILLLAALANCLLAKSEWSERIIPWPWYLSFSQNIWMSLQDWQRAWSIWFNQTWSLALEEQFYLALPLVIFVASRRILPHICIVLIFAAFLIRCLCYLTFTDERANVISHVLLPCRMDSLAIGVLIAIIFRNARLRAQIFSRLNVLYYLLVMLLVALGGFVTAGWGLATIAMQTVGLSLIALLYGVFLLIAILEGQGPISSFTRNAALRRLGLWAYCIYLIHIFVKTAIFDIYGPTVVGASIALVFMFGIAHLSWRYFERPLIMMGHRWNYSEIDFNSSSKAIAKDI